MQSLNDYITARQKEQAILGSVRLIEPNRDKSPIKKRYCSPGWSVNLTKRQVHTMLCKRRNCDECGWYWAWKWRKALKEKSTNDRFFGREVPKRALTLTFAENVPYVQMQNCLRFFWKFLRRGYPGVEYWGSVEFNQEHTQPHIHFVLANTGYIELDYLDYCFKTAQKWAGIQKIAFNLRIELIRKGIEAYFTKYITKLTGGKDEIPRRENWGGRFIRYSRKFFPVPVSAILAASPFNRALKRAESFDVFVFRVRQPKQGSLYWILDQIDELKKCEAIRAQGWNPIKDINAGTPLEPDNLLTGIETIPVYRDPEFTSDFFNRVRALNEFTHTGRFGPAF